MTGQLFIIFVLGNPSFEHSWPVNYTGLFYACMVFACNSEKLYRMKPELNPPELAQIRDFVDSDAEIPKDKLIERIAGKVSYSLLTYIKSTVFHHVIKDKFGKLYLV